MRLLHNIANINPIAQLLIVVLLAVVWFLPDIFGFNGTQPAYDFVLFGSITCFSLPTFWAHFIQFFCIIFICFWANHMCEHRRIMPTRSSLPFVCLLMVCTFIGRIQFFNASTVAFLLFLCALSQLLATYGSKQDCVVQAFNIGLLITAAAVFDRDYWWFAILFIVGLIILSSFTIRALCSLIAGILVLVALIVQIFYLTDSMNLLNYYIAPYHLFNFSGLTRPLTSEIVIGAVVALLLVISTLHYVTSNTIFNLNVRLSYTFVHVALILSLLLAVATSRIDLLLEPALYFTMLVISFYFTTSNTRFSNIAFISFFTIGIVCKILLIFGL